MHKQTYKYPDAKFKGILRLFSRTEAEIKAEKKAMLEMERKISGKARRINSLGKEVPPDNRENRLNKVCCFCRKSRPRKSFHRFSSPRNADTKEMLACSLCVKKNPEWGYKEYRSALSRYYDTKRKLKLGCLD